MTGTFKVGQGGGRLLLLAAGFTLWSIAFVVLYSMLSVGCEFGWDRIEIGLGLTLQRVQLVGLFALFVAAHVLLMRILRPRADVDTSPAGRFITRVAWLTAIAALGASLFSFAGVFALTSCGI